MLHTYCLMEKHVHLLIEENSGYKDLFIKKLEGNYAINYNRNYERIVHFFKIEIKVNP